jgi:hypothetical protein
MLDVISGKLQQPLAEASGYKILDVIRINLKLPIER